MPATEQVTAICRDLATLSLDAPSELPLGAIRDALKSEILLCLHYYRTERGWGISHWRALGLPDEAEQLFADAIATTDGEFAWYRPSDPPAAQRNAPIEALRFARLETRGAFERAPLFRGFLKPLGLHRHHQLRVLLYDGNRFLRWFGILQARPIQPQQHAILARLIAPLRRRFAAEDRIAMAGATDALVQLLDRVPEAACLLDAHGRVVRANAAAQHARFRELDPAERLRDPSALIALHEDGPIRWLYLEPKDGAGAQLRWRAETATRLWTLTARQRQILECVLHGLSNGAIARKLEIAERTVELHITTIFEKSGLDSRSELISAVLLSERYVR